MSSSTEELSLEERADRYVRNLADRDVIRDKIDKNKQELSALLTEIHETNLEIAEDMCDVKGEAYRAAKARLHAMTYVKAQANANAQARATAKSKGSKKRKAGEEPH